MNCIEDQIEIIKWANELACNGDYISGFNTSYLVFMLNEWKPLKSSYFMNEYLHD